mgnify:CR=1 FL=1
MRAGRRRSRDAEASWRRRAAEGGGGRTDFGGDARTVAASRVGRVSGAGARRNPVRQEEPWARGSGAAAGTGPSGAGAERTRQRDVLHGVCCAGWGGARQVGAIKPIRCGGEAARVE